ncbi:Hypothetical_protein [Hexamita inflata]|uniref:Hypothetical_protein n=1 Tax=Hexamita inflata TaxID=28002 RepID=A0AA86TJQ7_9EUKA|nr:Hypothetical protein HINF_LOCUS2718 [Hexamita inflata]
MIQSLQTIPIQRATAYEEWLNGTIIHFVEKFQSKFRSVESQGFNKMSKFSISATSLNDHSSNGKTDMLPYLKAVWKNNEYMVGLLSIFETLTVSNGSVERLFSFTDKQVTFQEEIQIIKHLHAMAYIYVEKITNNINHIYTDDDENDEYE